MDDSLCTGRRCVAHEEQRRINTGLAERQSLDQAVDSHPVRAGIESGLGYRNSTVPIGIGFDNRKNNNALSNVTPELADIESDGIQVNLRPGKHIIWHM